MKESYWNYRIVYEDGIYTLREVFYNKKGIPDGWTDPITPMGETAEDLQHNLNQMVCAMLKPVLIPSKSGKILKEKLK